MPQQFKTIAPQLAKQLLDHYDLHGRDLPWRSERDLYRIWISEIMLQQTGVQTVIPYYHAFLQRFPTVGQLAEAEQEAVLSQWQGLGYYRRARMLHRAAQQIIAQHGGGFPQELADVVALPGVGPSTAAAILAIGRDQHHAILDGNVIRVLSRLLALDEPVDGAAGKKTLWQLARLLTPADRPGDYAQAIMDLGATLCSRQKPDCPSCPWQHHCVAASRNNPLAYPVKKSKKKSPQRYQCMWVLVDSAGRVALRQRPEEGLLGGMWEPLGEPLRSTAPDESTLEIAQKALTRQGLHGGELVEKESVQHVFTHFRLTVYPIYREIHSHTTPLPEGRWFTPQEITQLPISTLHRKVLKSALG
uniref:Adenine DNA glycosylase n=1 Tax=Magnetococcus massalia (strain MO-1) TaxID=451514 RepID=A0A1S7LNR9_MAGMO|nr:A/G-specific adenine glycosylase [Candidatus Magnetococcus massalia]